MNKNELTEIAQKCLDVVAAKQTETDKAKTKLEGAAEGIRFLLNSLVEVLEVEDGKSDKPVSTLTKV